MRSTPKTDDVLNAIKANPDLDAEGLSNLCRHVSTNYVNRLVAVFTSLRKAAATIPQANPRKLLEKVQKDSGWHYEPVSVDIINKMLAVLAPADQNALGAGTPEKVLRAIYERRGQPEFRQRLLKAYDGRCCITGCDAEQALEAAHIVSYAETGSQKIENGLLLRADVHTLFDLDLVTVNPNTLRVVLARPLRGTGYADLDGRRIRQPKSREDSPRRALMQRWKAL